MDTMTLVFMAGSNPVSWLIRTITRSRTSHVAIGTMLHGVPVLIQADFGGVQVSPRAQYLKRARVVAEFRWPGDPTVELERACRRLGEKYDYVGLLGFGFVVLARWFKRKARNPLSSPSATVCSELVRGIDPGGDVVPEWKALDPEQTTPEDLLDVCMASSVFEKVQQ